MDKLSLRGEVVVPSLPSRQPVVAGALGGLLQAVALSLVTQAWHREAMTLPGPHLRRDIGL
ncbi:MAG: hypothetical protein RLY86_1243 [Pseudomonadota bacterium]|jgi:hypothetical protein